MIEINLAPFIPFNRIFKVKALAANIKRKNILLSNVQIRLLLNYIKLDIRSEAEDYLIDEFSKASQNGSIQEIRFTNKPIGKISNKKLSNLDERISGSKSLPVARHHSQMAKREGFLICENEMPHKKKKKRLTKKQEKKLHQTRIMQNRYCNASFDVSTPNDIYNNHVHGLSDY